MNDLPLPPSPSAADFVGVAPADLRRNGVTLYRFDFTLDATPTQPVWLHLFADTRYRLWVNGEFVASGPARFVAGFPEYDSHDLRPWLRPGDNCLAVDVHAYGCSSYQSMPAGRDGLIAWGRCGELDFRTPGAWRMRPLDAWAEDTALFSFAQNACEICDTRRIDPAWYLPGPAAPAGWSAPRLLPATERIWGPLAPRSVPQSTFQHIHPAHIETAGPLADHELRFGFHFPSRANIPSPPLREGLRQVFKFWIHSPVAREVALARHWGEYWLDGVPLPSAPDQGGLRIVNTLPLRAGWNCFCGHVEWLDSTAYWDALFGLPSDAGLRIAARPEDACPARLSLASELVPAGRVHEWLHDGRPVERDGWLDHDGDTARLTPARLLAWQQLASVSVRQAPCSELPRHAVASPSGQLWNFAFAEEILGHVCMDIEGAPGQLVDVGLDDWLRGDGAIDLYRTSPYVHTAERHILRGGRQRLIALNIRGGRYVQVTAYAPPFGQSPARLHSVGVLSAGTLPFRAGGFTTDDPLDARIWDASVRTLAVSTEDAYSDSPWRERGTYIGDFRVNQSVHRLLSADLRLPRRALRVFAQAQLENGQLPAAAPAFLRRAHEDFSLIWVISVWEHWELAGDLALVAEVWPAIERLWQSAAWQAGDHGLWSGDGLHLFIDWGVLPSERQGQANAVLNAFRIAALEKSAALARLLGHHARAADLDAQALRVREAFTRALWLPDHGRYAASLHADGTPAATAAKHANLLAWVFRIGTAEQLDRVESYVFAAIRDNPDAALSLSPDGHFELYFFGYVLDALAARGHVTLAHETIRRHWTPLVADGFGTLGECFFRFQNGVGSRCHSWSGHPAPFYTRWGLGLRQTTPGDPDHWILDPVEIPGINQASGELPHSRGVIRARWARHADGSLHLEVTAPEGVTVSVPQP